MAYSPTYIGMPVLVRDGPALELSFFADVLSYKEDQEGFVMGSANDAISTCFQCSAGTVTEGSHACECQPHEQDGLYHYITDPQTQVFSAPASPAPFFASLAHMLALNPSPGPDTSEDQSTVVSLPQLDNLQPTALSVTVAAPHAPAPRVENRQCPVCLKIHDNKLRADACLNKHCGDKPYKCNGCYRSIDCKKKYGSAELLRRHRRPLQDGNTMCSACHVILSKQNLSRHRRICQKYSTSDIPVGK